MACFLKKLFIAIAIVMLGILSGVLLGALPGAFMSFMYSAALVLVVLGIPLIIAKLLSARRHGLLGGYLFGFIPALLLSFLIVYGSHEGEGNPRWQSLFPQLYDDCDELRYNLTCDSYDMLSKGLVALRCFDYSIISVQPQKLRPGYTDLMQQCHGG